MESTDQPELVIRDRHEGDIDSIVTLALESLTWHADTFANIRRPPPRDALGTGFEEIVEQPDNYFRVAVLATTVVGFLTASIHPPRQGGIEALDAPSVYISDVVVTESVRRRGIARALLVDVEDWARQQKCHTIRLNMHAGNGPAQRLYEQLDYQPSWVTFRRDLM